MSPTLYDRRRRLSLAFVAAVSSACYTTLAPVLPLEFDGHGISEQWVSAVFLAFSIGSTAAPPLVARRLESTGTVGVMARSMAGMFLLFLCLGIVFEAAALLLPRGSADYGAATVLLTAVVQFFMGALFSAVSTGYYSLATLVFAEKESAMSSIEAAIGSGYILGPIFGSVVYAEMGYRATYAFVSLVMLMMALVTWKIISPFFLKNDHVDEVDCIVSSDLETQNDFNDYNSFENDNDRLATRSDRSGIKVMDMNTPQKREAQKPTAISLLKHPKIILSAATIMWINVSWTCIEPLLAKRLADYFHAGKKEIGMIFSLNNVVYVPAVYLARYLPRHNVLRHRTISLSTLLTPIAMLFVGSGNFSLLIFGVLLLGLLPAPVWIMLLPFMQEESMELVQDPNMRRRLNDVTAGIYNSFMLMGQVVGYAIGALMGSHVFTLTTQLVAFLIFVQAILFYYGTNTAGRYIQSARDGKARKEDKKTVGTLISNFGTECVGPRRAL